MRLLDHLIEVIEIGSGSTVMYIELKMSRTEHYFLSFNNAFAICTALLSSRCSLYDTCRVISSRRRIDSTRHGLTNRLNGDLNVSVEAGKSNKSHVRLSSWSELITHNWKGFLLDLGYDKFYLVLSTWFSVPRMYVRVMTAQ